MHCSKPPSETWASTHHYGYFIMCIRVYKFQRGCFHWSCIKNGCSLNDLVFYGLDVKPLTHSFTPQTHSHLFTVLLTIHTTSSQCEEQLRVSRRLWSHISNVSSDTMEFHCISARTFRGLSLFLYAALKWTGQLPDCPGWTPTSPVDSNWNYCKSNDCGPKSPLNPFSQASKVAKLPRQC